MNYTNIEIAYILANKIYIHYGPEVAADPIILDYLTKAAEYAHIKHTQLESQHRQSTEIQAVANCNQPQPTAQPAAHNSQHPAANKPAGNKQK